jgi:hypothetical protein
VPVHGDIVVTVVDVAVDLAGGARDRPAALLCRGPDPGGRNYPAPAKNGSTARCG